MGIIYKNGIAYGNQPNGTVPSGGTTGQVLKKASNTDYDTEWANESGGGGGTSDIAEEYDPISGVYSVGDYCIYQTVLYKCITAISTPEAFDSTKWSEVTVGDELNGVRNTLNSEIATRQTYVRPNLLDNWYFVGGGSQQNGGQFPINQRGQTIYSTLGYTMDRWKTDPTTELSLVSSGATLKTGTYIYEIIPDSLWNDLKGKIVTCSILFSDGSLYDYQVTVPTTNADTAKAENGWYYGINAYSGHLWFLIYIHTTADKTVQAVKLELGSGQTLAHQENGHWVLNEIPDYTEQFLRCCGSKADSSDTYANQELVPDDYLIRGLGVADLNSITTFSANMFMETTANTPVPNAQGLCVTFPGYQNTNFVSIQLAITSGHYYMRYSFGAGFSEWKQISVI